MQATQVNNTPRLTLEQYQAQALASNQFRTSGDALNQLRFGLFGEIGGLLSAVKKEHRDLAPAQHNSVTEEFGDALWYATTVAEQCGSSLLDIGASAVAELQSRFKVSRDMPKQGLSFEAIDGLLDFCATEVEALDLGQELRRLGSHAGSLLQAQIQPDLAGLRIEDLLSSIFADMALAAALFKQRLATIARSNLEKIESRWPPAGTSHIPLFDEKMPSLERFPRQIKMHFIERHKGDGTPYVVQQLNGVNIGDRLTDNRLEADGYRFHDVFHLAYVVHLGWSPVMRALLRLKRKSAPSLDENEDGARATIIEEGIATWIFNHAVGRKLFADGVPGKLEYGMLKQVKDMVSGYEVQACPIWQWERAILDGFTLFRKLFQNGGGIVVADLTARTLVFESSVVEPEAPPAAPARPIMVTSALPPSDQLLQ